MMSQKRQQEDVKARSEGISPEDKRRKIPTFKKYDLFKFYFFMLLLQCYV